MENHEALNDPSPDVSATLGTDSLRAPAAARSESPSESHVPPRAASTRTPRARPTKAKPAKVKSAKSKPVKAHAAKNKRKQPKHSHDVVLQRSIAADSRCVQVKAAVRPSELRRIQHWIKQTRKAASASGNRNDGRKTLSSIIRALLLASLTAWEKRTGQTSARSAPRAQRAR